jgi:hypothetical protein
MPFPSDPRSRSVLDEKLVLLLWPFVFYGEVFDTDTTFLSQRGDCILNLRMVLHEIWLESTVHDSSARSAERVVFLDAPWNPSTRYRTSHF